MSDGARRPPSTLVAGLASELAHAPSGLSFIYHALDRIVAEHGLDDAILVLQSSGTGRQAFRAGRRAVTGSWATARAVGSPGLYTAPSTVDAGTADSLADLCGVALRLDLLAHDATHDALTGLLNRRSFDDLLTRAVSRSVRYGWGFTLVTMDVNRFKDLNDRLGHAAGDEVLRAVGRGLLATLRASDVAARIGGDEFAMILDGTDSEVGQSLGARLSEAAGSMLGWAEVTFAVGSATAPAEGSDAVELLRLADERLYESKGRAR